MQLKKTSSLSLHKKNFKELHSLALELIPEKIPLKGKKPQTTKSGVYLFFTSYACMYHGHQFTANILL